MNAMLLAVLLSQLAPGSVALPELPVLRQPKALWQRTIARMQLPPDAVGTWDPKQRAIIVLAGHPEVESTIVHERLHILYAEHLSPADREEFEAAWRRFRHLLPWPSARARATEAFAYLGEIMLDGGESARLVRRLLAKFPHVPKQEPWEFCP